MSISLKQYTMRYLIITILVIITIWASIFYAFILDEVYDNVDDGLRNQKLLILREVYENPEVLNTTEYGVNQFKIKQVSVDMYTEKNTFSNEFFYMPYDDEDEPYRVLRTGFYGPDNLTYNLEIRTSTVEQDDLVIDLSIALAILYIVMMISIFLLNQFVLTRAWRPFKVILSGLEKYKIGTDKKINNLKTDVSEFKELHRYVNDMIDRNEAVFADQKLFIENASHELQTPLAIMQNKIDLLLEEDTISEDAVVKLVDTKSAIQRLIDLNKSLLLLSKIENRQYLHTEEISLNAIAKDLQENFEDLIIHKGIQLDMEENSEFVLNGNYDLLYIAVSNLFRNAIRYTDRGGMISIVIDANSIVIKNTSTQGALPVDYVFDRFYKGSPDSSSNGLGLSIVQSIMRITAHTSVLYSFENNFHIFSIRYQNS